MKSRKERQEKILGNLLHAKAPIELTHVLCLISFPTINVGDEFIVFKPKYRPNWLFGAPRYEATIIVVNCKTAKETHITIEDYKMWIDKGRLSNDAFNALCKFITNMPKSLVDLYIEFHRLSLDDAMRKLLNNGVCGSHVNPGVINGEGTIIIRPRMAGKTTVKKLIESMKEKLNDYKATYETDPT